MQNPPDLNDANAGFERTVFAPGRVPRGTRLNGVYEIDDLIANGGMGEVYRGHNIQTQDPVAIKMILPELSSNPDAISLFRREASTLHNLNHEAIVRYFVFSVDPGLQRAYLAMEYVEGPSLAIQLKQGPLDLASVRILQRRIGDALETAHRYGVIHRDISSDNIILPSGDIRRAKIIDFGIARSHRPGEGTIIGGGFAGKYNYVSPEQLGLAGGEVTAKSDIYSFGLVLAEALLGRPIDMSGTQLDVIEKRRVVPDLSRIDPSMRPLLEAMLQPLPAMRPESMAAVAGWGQPTLALSEPDLRSQLRPPPTPVTPRAPTPTPPPRRSAAPWIALAIVALLVAGLGGVAVLRPDLRIGGIALSDLWAPVSQPTTEVAKGDTQEAKDTQEATPPPVVDKKPSLPPLPPPADAPPPEKKPAETQAADGTTPPAGTTTAQGSAEASKTTTQPPAGTDTNADGGQHVPTADEIVAAHEAMNPAQPKPGTTQPADAAQTANAQQTIQPPVTLQPPKSTEIPKATEQPKTAERPKTAEQPKATESAKTAELPKTAEPPKATQQTATGKPALPPVGGDTPTGQQQVASGTTAANKDPAKQPTQTPATATATEPGTGAKPKNPTADKVARLETPPRAPRRILSIEDALVGRDYTAALPPFDAGVPGKLTLSVDPRLPDGLTFVDHGGGFGSIGGRPTRPGAYDFDVVATNELGLTASMTTRLTVQGNPVAAPPPVATGEDTPSGGGTSSETTVTPIPKATDKPQTQVAALSPQEATKNFVNRFDGGPCFAIRSVLATASTAAIEGFGAEVGPVNRLESAFSQERGFEPQINFRLVSPEQCGALDLAVASGLGSPAAPVLSIGNFEVGNGRPLTGTVANLSGRQLELLLVTNDGHVLNLRSLLQTGNGRASFSVPLTPDSSSDGAPQLLVAITAPQSIPSLQGFKAGMAADVIPALRQDLSRLGGNLDLQLFKLVR